MCEIQLCTPQCVEYVREKIPSLPIIRTPFDLDNNARPAKGCAVIMNFSGTPHIGYMPYPPFPGGVFITDSNRDGLCGVSEMFLEWDSKILVGFWCPVDNF